MITGVQRTSARCSAISHAMWRVGGSIVLAAHGLIHIIGVLLWWHLADSGAVSFADVSPRPGTGPAILLGGVWAFEIGLFVVAAVLLAMDSWTWIAPATVAVLISIPLLSVLGTATLGGVVLDVAILAGALRVAAMEGIAFRTRGQA